MEILNLPECQVCGFQSKRLTNHIRKLHGMTTKAYKELYPNVKLVFVSDEQKAKASALTKQWFSNEENRKSAKKYHRSIWQKIFWIEKGLSEQEAIAKVSSLQKRQFTKETRELLSQHSAGKSNPMSLENIAQRKGCSLAEAKTLTPCYGRKKDKHPMFGKHHTPEALEKICANTPIKFFQKSGGEKELQEYVIK